MLWTFLLWIVTHVLRHFFGSPVPALEAPRPSYESTPYGPQTLEEERIALEALHGNPQGDMRFNFDAADPFSGVGEKMLKYRWPGGIIYYKIDSAMSSQVRSLVKQAIDHYQKHTCLKFVEAKNQPDYVHIQKLNGCYATVGKQGGKQLLSLGKGCEYIGTVVHELGHAVGLFHEQQRSDRDRYIHVFMHNVIPGCENNFRKLSSEHELRYTAYDCDSIMQYGEYSCSIDDKVKKTMAGIKIDCKLKEPYDKPGLTTRDMDIVNKMYNCGK